jgi:hypothetical protein
MSECTVEYYSTYIKVGDGASKRYNAIWFRNGFSTSTARRGTAATVTTREAALQIQQTKVERSA